MPGEDSHLSVRAPLQAHGEPRGARREVRRHHKHESRGDRYDSCL
jgi:hypothetical protein